MSEAELVEATIRNKKPTEPEIRDLDAVRRALNAEFDALVSSDTLIVRNKPELKQTEMLLRAHLQKVFGDDDHQWAIGAFSERDLPGRLQMGWMILSKGLFAPYTNGKPTWSDNIARKLGVWTSVDGTIRWGSRGELYVCFMRRDLWVKHRMQEQDAADAKYRSAFKVGKQRETPEPGVTIETEIGITKEQVRGKARSAIRGKQKEN